MSLIKIKVNLEGQVKSLEIIRSELKFSSMKSFFESQYGRVITTFKYRATSGSYIPITQDSELQQAVFDSVKAGARFLIFDAEAQPKVTSTYVESYQQVNSISSKPSPITPSTPSTGGGKFCANCGTPRTSGRFCPECGSKWDDGFAPSSNPTPSVSSTPSRPATLNPSGCPGCGQEVSGMVVHALDRTWHQSCFVCNRCLKSLSGTFVQGENGMPCCEKCFIVSTAETCFGCGNSIIGEYTQVDGKNYHPNCFVCFRCKVPFQTTFFMKNGKAMCGKCANAP